MRREALARPSRQTIATEKFQPAPYGGWNARDPVAAMSPMDARALDNFIAGDLTIKAREGYGDHATAIAGSYVESLMEWSGPASAKLMAAGPTTIYDVTTAGAATSSRTGMTSGRWQHVNIANSGGSYLWCCNGTDDCQHFDGTTWAAPALTGVTSASVIHVSLHMNRLFLTEKDSLNLWHLGTKAIAGAVTNLDVRSLFNMGGYLVGSASWTRDGGSGLDDYFVILSSRGQVLIYQGTDPTAAATWSLVGRFKIPEPIGRRCFVQLGGDLGVLTSRGLVSLSAVLNMTESGQAKSAITDKIVNAFTVAFRTKGTKYGWQCMEYPKQQLAIINVPQTEREEFHQYVAYKGKWSRWKGIEANVFGLLNDKLYFGMNDGTVRVYGESIGNDDGTPIDAVAIGAYNLFGTPNLKRCTRLRPQIYTQAGYTPTVALQFDFDETINVYEPETAVSSSPPWGSPWGTPWSAPNTAQFGWFGVNGTGAAVSTIIAARGPASGLGTFSYNGSLLIYEQGGMI